MATDMIPQSSRIKHDRDGDGIGPYLSLAVSGIKNCIAGKDWRCTLQAMGALVAGLAAVAAGRPEQRARHTGAGGALGSMT